ncbi:hypothetical protein GIB67_017996 [Kingdonia uniflora]|uniref:Pentatricopeptide repeat-containing protein n=1 Tax=Kingdonia uniflora TaxID=39325 RepID=A0A7J7NWV9_9MAGN|nr:hypothetical protein GIB67_017996 [Kingdonia uniflora]
MFVMVERGMHLAYLIMQRPENGCKSDNITYLLLLQGSAQLCGLSFGEKIYDYVEEHGYGKSVKICNSLIAMYTRCGGAEEVDRILSLQDKIECGKHSNREIVEAPGCDYGYLGVLRYAPEGHGHLDCIDYWAGDKWIRSVVVDLSHSLFSSIEGPHKSSLMATKHDSTATPVFLAKNPLQNG